MPRAAPVSRTANVWPVTGTGVNGRWISHCAANAVSAAAPITSSTELTRDRGTTRWAMTADVIFISYKPDLCNLKDLGPSPAAHRYPFIMEDQNQHRSSWPLYLVG